MSKTLGIDKFSQFFGGGVRQSGENLHGHLNRAPASGDERMS
jgi:hypothetical protein